MNGRVLPCGECAWTVVLGDGPRDHWGLDGLPATFDPAVVYRCDWCGHGAFKDAWGPGRITCPHCGRVARSPAETAAAPNAPAEQWRETNRLMEALRKAQMGRIMEAHAARARS